MAITVPITDTEIRTSEWGIPITNEVNRLSPIVDRSVAAPHCLIASTTNQAFPNTTVQIVAFGAAVFANPVSMYTPGSTRIVFPRTGAYLVGFSEKWDTAAGGGIRSGFLMKNGNGGDRIAQFEFTVGGAGYVVFSGVSMLRAAANDYLEMRAHQGSGATLNLNSGTEMWAVWQSD